MKKLVYITIFCLTTFSVSAQQEYMLTHYMFNKMAINPAYTGTKNAISITGIHRSQWVAFEGAPTTQSITAHMPIENKNFGVGIGIVNEKVGPTKNLGITGSFAYQFTIKRKNKLSLGLSGGLNIFSSRLNSLTIINQNDAAFAESINNEFVPNVGFGGYYYGEKFFVGISTPKLLQNNLNVDDPTGTAIVVSHEKRHYFVMGGTIFNLTSDQKFKLKPTVLFKVTGGAPLQLDLTGNVIYNDKITAGLSLRTSDALGLLLGYNISDDFTVGYSFDFSFTNTTFNYNRGSHEVMLRYNISKGNSKYESKYF